MTATRNLWHQLPPENWDQIFGNLRHFELVKACQNPDFADLAVSQAFWKGVLTKHFKGIEIGPYLKDAISYVGYDGLYLMLSYIKITYPGSIQARSGSFTFLGKFTTSSGVTSGFMTCTCGLMKYVDDFSAYKSYSVHDGPCADGEYRYELPVTDEIMENVVTVAISGGLVNSLPAVSGWPNHLTLVGDGVPHQIDNIPVSLIDLCMKHPKWAGEFIQPLCGQSFNYIYQNYPQMRKYLEVAIAVQDGYGEFSLDKDKMTASITLTTKELKSLLQKEKGIQNYIADDLAKILPREYSV